MPADLQEHLAIGRASMPGPVSGGYMPLCFGPFIDAAAPGAVDVFHFAWQAPFACRVERIDLRTRGASTANIAARAYKNTSTGGISLTGATALHASIAAVHALGYFTVHNGTGATAAFTTTTSRDLAKGDYLFIAYTYDGTGQFVAAGPHSIFIQLVSQGHINEFSTAD